MKKQMQIQLAIFMAMIVFVAQASFRDASPGGDGSAVFPLADGTGLRVDVLRPDLMRIRRGKGGMWMESGMNRYGFLKTDYPRTSFEKTDTGVKTARAELRIDRENGTLSFVTPKRTVNVWPAISGKGFDLRFNLSDKERVYGLGDCSRTNIMRRGMVYDFWIRNWKNGSPPIYFPVPNLISHEGWGVFVNTTWRHTWDVGKSRKDVVAVTAGEGDVDFYLFTADGYRGLIDIFTELTGRPVLLPIWGYGLTFVNNDSVNDWALLNNARRFRDYGIPCDTLGLEPRWMKPHFDFTTNKNWDKSRFYFPFYDPQGGHTWIGSLARIGFKLSLWLTTRYDFTRYEEQRLAALARASGRTPDLPNGIPENWMCGLGDLTNSTPPHGSVVDIAKGKIPEGHAPWFEHLKKFVDQGVRCFKLDTTGGPPKLGKWANGMSEEEAHNLYPILYARQMAEGFESRTGLRLMSYTASGYAGLQKYAASWAGDTGGGHDALVSMLNLAFSGHSNQSCDMLFPLSEGFHFGFIQPWSQHNSWDCYYEPWFMREELIPTFTAYDQLRYRLIPYVYSTAFCASRTGWPIMRPLCMVYPDDPSFDSIMDQYMFGDSLLVSAFVNKIKLPDGVWFDWWTGARVEGGREIPFKPTDEKGGTLFVKAGAIIPTWPVKQHLEKGWNETVTFDVWPERDGSFELYEDDGETPAYKDGRYATTLVSCTNSMDAVTFTVNPRKGSFKSPQGVPGMWGGIYRGNGMPPTRDFSAAFHVGKKPTRVTLDEKTVDGKWDEARRVFEVPLGACGPVRKTIMLWR